MGVNFSGQRSVVEPGFAGLAYFSTGLLTGSKVH